MKQSVCLYFRLHQPFRLRAYVPGQVGVDHDYFDDVANEAAINDLADMCYLPANSIILSNITKTKERFKVNYSISGSLLDLLFKYRRDVVDSFRKLVSTGCVEILAETYYNSLSFLNSKNEFSNQVVKHSEFIKKVFDFEPRVVKNTELIYRNDLAQLIYSLGYNGILCEGAGQILQQRTPNKIYAGPNSGDLSLLLRNSRLSDDIAFRFDDKSWSEYPLTAEKFARWIHSHPLTEHVINLLIDYETFGIHKKIDTGIFEFLDALPGAILKSEKFQFSTASDAIEQYYPADLYDVPVATSWEDKLGASYVWSENAKQTSTLKKIYSLEKQIQNSSNDQLISTWSKLQDADYFLYMRDKVAQRNASTVGDAYERYKNILTDLEISLIRDLVKKNKLDFIPLTHNVY